MSIARKKFYIQSQGKILFTRNKQIDDAYWDNVWQRADLLTAHSNPKNRLVSKVTMKYLNPARDTPIIEAGCGIGHMVRLLNNLGYCAYGIDYAKDTVDNIRELFPDLRISCQNVESTSFQASLFSGYWSIGVIEHFIESYSRVIQEANRILRPGGYAFVSFPYISPLRRVKIWLKHYPVKKEISHYCVTHFNQYALDARTVIHDFSSQGFSFVRCYRYNGVLGWIEDIGFAKAFMRRIYSSKSKRVKYVRFVLNKILSVIMSHCILLVFKKTAHLPKRDN